MKSAPIFLRVFREQYTSLIFWVEISTDNHEQNPLPPPSPHTHTRNTRTDIGSPGRQPAFPPAENLGISPLRLTMTATHEDTYKVCVCVYACEGAWVCGCLFVRVQVQHSTQPLVQGLRDHEWIWIPESQRLYLPALHRSSSRTWQHTT